MARIRKTPSKNITPPPSSQHPGRRAFPIAHPNLCFALAAAVLLLLLYHAVLTAPFVYDDLDQIARNPALDSWHATFTRFVLAPVHFTSGFLGAGSSTYRPVFWITLALDQHLWSGDPTGFHLTSLLFHWLNGCLLFALLRRLKLPTVTAAASAILWLSLPILTESVAWISARAYLLSTFFLLLSAWTALAFLSRPGWKPVAAFTLCSLLAVFSHEQGALLPSFLVLAFILDPKPRSTRHWFPLFALSLLADASYFLAQHAVGAHPSEGFATLWSVGLEFWRYLQLIALPIHMSLERSTSVPANQPSFAALLAWVGIVALVAIVFLLRKRFPAVAAGVALLLLGLLPFCGFIPIYQGMAERFTYLPAIGLAIIVATATLQPKSKNILLMILGACFLWSSWRTLTRVSDWQQPIALFQHSLEATPRSAYLWQNLGILQRDHDDPEAALTSLRRAIALKPDYAPALTAIGDIHLAQSHPDLALADYNKSLSIAPNDPKTLLNEANALQQTNHLAEAETQYKRVLTLTPRNSGACVDLESLYIQQGRHEEAIAMYKQAIAIDPTEVAAYFDLGVMFQQLGQDREALAFYRKVLQLKPGDEQTLLYLHKLHVSQP